MNYEEKINELKEEIKELCVEVYGENGDEIIELIEKSNLVFTSSLLMFTLDEQDTISLCHFFKKCIMRDKKKLEEG